ncbi:MAG: hypothetical protein QM696_07495 [Steroidobacteraceae bacterium]
MSVVYSLYDALVSINVPDDKARAVIDALEHEMMDKLATKAELDNLRTEMSADFKLVRQEISTMSTSLSKDLQIRMAELQNNLTIRLGVMMASMIAAATALVGLGQYLR